MDQMLPCHKSGFCPRALHQLLQRCRRISRYRPILKNIFTPDCISVEKYRDEIAKFGKEFEQKVDIIVGKQNRGTLSAQRTEQGCTPSRTKGVEDQAVKSISHAAGGFSVSVFIYCKDPQRHKKPQSLLADQENVVIIMKEKIDQGGGFRTQRLLQSV